MGVDNFFQLGGGGGGGATPETQAVTQRKMVWAIKCVSCTFNFWQLKWGGLKPPQPPLLSTPLVCVCVWGGGGGLA